MNFVVIGTDHRFQPREPSLEGVLRALLDLQYIEPLTVIVECAMPHVISSASTRPLRWEGAEARVASRPGKSGLTQTRKERKDRKATEGPEPVN
ncbi:MAG: hypothetical protein ABSE93_25335 [Terriglobia bacterium]|jgi:hypothetical protein